MDQKIEKKMFFRLMINARDLSNARWYASVEKAIEDDDRRLSPMVYGCDVSLLGEIRRKLIPAQVFPAVEVELDGEIIKKK